MAGNGGEKGMSPTDKECNFLKPLQVLVRLFKDKLPAPGKTMQVGIHSFKGVLWWSFLHEKKKPTKTTPKQQNPTIPDQAYK